MLKAAAVGITLVTGSEGGGGPLVISGVQPAAEHARREAKAVTDIVSSFSSLSVSS